MAIASNMVEAIVMQNARLIDPKVQDAAWITACFSTFTGLMTPINLVTNALPGPRPINPR